METPGWAAARYPSWQLFSLYMPAHSVSVRSSAWRAEQPSSGRGRVAAAHLEMGSLAALEEICTGADAVGVDDDADGVQALVSTERTPDCRGPSRVRWARLRSRPR